MRGLSDCEVAEKKEVKLGQVLDSANLEVWAIHSFY